MSKTSRRNMEENEKRGKAKDEQPEHCIEQRERKKVVEKGSDKG